jgi:molybdenum cofactor sulfurtransferase
MSKIGQIDLAETSYEAFCAEYPQYASTASLDQLRARDFWRLETGKQVYLDYTGGSLYGQYQLDRHWSMLSQSICGNPHSSSSPSRLSTEWMEQARSAVLTFFHASADDYSVIFTPNATGALRLVGEAYPFSWDSRCLLLVDNHNSVNGIREFARSRGAAVGTAAIRDQDLRIDQSSLLAELSLHSTAPCLFVYPAQSNFSGVQHALEWVEIAQEQGWDVLVDAAAFVPTNRLDLSQWKPDFIAISFYKMFGWPTGVGCLIARKIALNKLRRPWFSGGTVWAASAQAYRHLPMPGVEGFEDGTVNYLNLPAVRIGLDYIQRSGVEIIHTRTMCLTGWLLKQLSTLRHSNGTALSRIYGPVDMVERGPTIAFNFLDADGRIVDERIVEREANQWGISLRTGCFCNPGAGEIAFGLELDKISASFERGRSASFDEQLSILGMQSGGAVRISLGIVTNFKDVQRFLDLAARFRDARPSARGLTPRSRC